MKISFRALAIALLTSGTVTTAAYADGIPMRIECFDISQVRLKDSPFKHAEDMDLRYILGLDPDRLLAPYYKEAGLKPKAYNYTNWENTGLDGHIGGHYLSALVYMYAATGNEETGRRLDYMLTELKKCQDAAGDGYLCGVPGGRQTWNEIKNGHIEAGAHNLNGKWVPLYNLHKIMAGLRDAWAVGGRRDALDMLIRLTDWFGGVVGGLDDSQIQAMLASEHGGINEIVADVAEYTGDRKYLKLARRLSHQALLRPLMAGKDSLTGLHANTQIPKVIGFKRIADIDGDSGWNSAAEFFWHTVVGRRSISIGGNSYREHFNAPDDFIGMYESEQGPETCNTYNMLRLSKMLYATTADVEYIDYYERALFNHILSSINPVQGGFVYFTPIRPGHYRVYSQPQTSFWCCVGSGMENHARYGEMIYAHAGGDLYVNLFIPSVLRWGDMEVEQTTTFPEEDGTSVVLRLKHPDTFAVSLRCPSWTDAGKASVYVNGERQEVNADDGYFTIKRTWNDGDSIRLVTPMHISAERLPDGSDIYSFLYGPIVLAADMGHQDQDGLFADDSRGGHIAAGKKLPLGKMPVIVDDNGTDPSLYINKVASHPLTFKLSGVSPKQYDGMTLRPFSSIYECRYMLYWPVMTSAELKHRQDSVARQDSLKARLDAMTADIVVCGEQQPESDHGMTGQSSRGGTSGDRHWREAEGWFAYSLATHGRTVNKIIIEYEPGDNREAKIYVNGADIGSINAKNTGHTVTEEFILSEKTPLTRTVEVRIEGSGNRTTPRVYSIRAVAE